MRNMYSLCEKCALYACKQGLKEHCVIKQLTVAFYLKFLNKTSSAVLLPVNYSLNARLSHFCIVQKWRQTFLQNGKEINIIIHNNFIFRNILTGN